MRARFSGEPVSAAALAVKTDILPPRYRGPERIGHGGMGDIYRATDSTLDRTVAVKILAERYAQDLSVRTATALLERVCPGDGHANDEVRVR